MSPIPSSQKCGSRVSVAGADANPEDCPNNWTPLHAAVESRRSEVVPLLLQAAADPNMSRSEDGWTPLHFAARSGDLQIAPRHGLRCVKCVLDVVYGCLW